VCEVTSMVMIGQEISTPCLAALNLSRAGLWHARDTELTAVHLITCHATTLLT
jgi:hypothetical protein